MPYSSVADLPANIQKKSSTAQRKWMAVFNGTYSSCMEDEGDASACESKAFRNANGVTKASEDSDLPHQAHEGVVMMQLEKADSRVDYRVAAEGDTETCGNCRFFDSLCMSCSVVEGSIDAGWKCSLWTKQFVGVGGDSPSAYREPLYQVFVEAAVAFATPSAFDKPQWIPFLPTPGKFQHPKHGEIVITTGQNEEMVASFKDEIYQKHIPLDAEHETKLSGAVAWIKDMRMNDNGSADALVEFTGRGKTLLEGGQFKYISPEWFTDWRDPATGVVHRNVVAGGAITTRPFFKDKVLRALVATEAGIQIEGREGDLPMPDPKDPKAAGDPAGDPKVDPPKAGDPPPAAKTFTEAERDEAVTAAVKAAEDKIRGELAADTRTFAERLTAAETAAAEAKTAREASEARVIALEKSGRHQRFSEMVMGRGGEADGAAWAGETEKNVTFLEALADKIGETDPMFLQHVEQQKAVAAQLSESKLFSDMGSGATPAASGGASSTNSEIDAKLESMTQARLKADPSKTHAKHFSEVMESPEAKALYQRQTSRQG